MTSHCNLAIALILPFRSAVVIVAKKQKLRVKLPDRGGQAQEPS
jgi:hypothetical protein